MKKKILLLSFLMCVGLLWLNAQEFRVTGTITDNTGEPLPGVTVQIKGSSTGTATDVDGNYSLQVPGTDAVLVFSFIGYETQEITVGDQRVINISLNETTQAIEDVIVIAYGTTTKASFTGSAAVVKAEKINKIPVSSFEKALVGNIAGVQVANTTGQPGSGTEIRIRGIGSFSASNEPLYVIDGVPVMSGSLNSTAGGLPTGNVMSTIPSGDIENITVLKDAAAASLYGSRAANGVILITTKQGREGVTRYSLKSVYGFSDWAVDNYKTVSGEDFLMLHRESMENYLASGNAPPGFDVDAEMLANDWVKPAEGFTDWRDHLFRTGITKNIELSATGGTEKTQFYISGSYFDQEGVAYKSSMKRYSGRVNVTHKASDRITVGMNFLNSYGDQEIVDGGSRYYDPFYNYARNCFPTEGPYLADGTYRPELQSGYYNVVMERELNETSAKIFRSMNTGFLEIRPLEFLTFRSTNSIDWMNNDDTRYASPLSRSGDDELGYVRLSNRKRITTTTSNLLTFDKIFAEFHHVNIIAAQEAEVRKAKRYYTEGNVLPNETLRSIGATAVPVEASGYSEGTTMLSFLSRLNYDYRNKYYFSTSIRRDGSSKLGADERWANFWSVSGAWRLSSEDFLSNQTIIDDLKIRVSYGTNGTLPPGYYDHLALYAYSSTYDGQVAAYENSIANSNLTWEQNANFNIGFDITLFRNFSATIEYFSRHTSDLLMNLPLAPTIGAGSTWVNIGEMDNKGLEFDLRTTNISTSDFLWTSTFNITTFENKIVKLNKGEDIIYSRFIRREGEAYNTFWLPLWAGVNPANGAPQWYIVDADGKKTGEVTGDIGEADKTIAGKADPDFFGSFGNNFSYKGFNLSFLFNFAVGGQIYYDSGYKSWNDGHKAKYAIPVSQLDRWQKPGDVAMHPQRIWKGNNDSDVRSSRFLLDNDFLRLKDITLSYNLPETLINRMGINNITVYVQATNYLTWCTQDIGDPEQRPNGMMNFEMPNNKTMTFGLEITF
ncbi:MAG TPA: TonB-dependent receptor [Bacteroidales bacterium]|nr:TonB-dependent receptor [Bacteroidales bacterium]